jgi:hypothetical protein
MPYWRSIDSFSKAPLDSFSEISPLQIRLW